jgi:hypothetical protein
MFVFPGFAGRGVIMTELAKMLVQSSIVRVPLGMILLVDNLILQQDLDMALEQQKHSKQLLGEILMRLGALKRNELEMALNLQKQRPL